MSTLDWLLICTLVFLVGVGVGWVLRYQRDNYMWRKIPGWYLEEIGKFRKEEEDKRV